jgi:hypothetical protein
MVIYIQLVTVSTPMETLIVFHRLSVEVSNLLPALHQPKSEPLPQSAKDVAAVRRKLIPKLPFTKSVSCA